MIRLNISNNIEIGFTYHTKNFLIRFRSGILCYNKEILIIILKYFVSIFANILRLLHRFLAIGF